MASREASCSLKKAQLFFWEYRTKLNELLNAINLNLCIKNTIIPLPTEPSGDMVDDAIQFEVEQKLINQKVNDLLGVLNTFIDQYPKGISLINEKDNDEG